MYMRWGAYGRAGRRAAQRPGAARRGTRAASRIQIDIETGRSIILELQQRHTFAAARAPQSDSATCIRACGLFEFCTFELYEFKFIGQLRNEPHALSLDGDAWSWRIRAVEVVDVTIYTICRGLKDIPRAARLGCNHGGSGAALGLVADWTSCVLRPRLIHIERGEAYVCKLLQLHGQLHGPVCTMTNLPPALVRRDS